MRVASWSMGVLAVAASLAAAADETPLQPPGVYIEGAADAKGRIPVEKIATAEAVRAGTKDLAKGMIGSALTGGLLGKPKITLIYAGPRGAARLASQPMFQFHFDPKAAAAPAKAPAPTDMASMMAMMEGGAQGEMQGARRPHEFALVRLEVKNDERFLVAQMDMKPAKPINCRVRQLGPTSWRVAPEKALPPGEYAFYVVPTQAGGGGGQRIWEFGVDENAAASR
jgi:hypothetical protein